jgi:hypothetical protein
MAEDQKQQLYRSSEAPTRGTRPAASPTGSDPLAELARLIGQTDPFAEFDRQNARRAAVPPTPPTAPPPSFGPSDYFDAPAAPPPAGLQPPPYAPPSGMRQPYATGDHYAAESEGSGHPADEHGGFDPPAYHPGNAQFAAEDEGYYEDGRLPKRRMGIMAIAAVFALAVIGTAGAFGYRAIFGGSRSSSPPPVIKADTAPSKIMPAAASKTPNKLIYDRVADHAQDEKLVSREEKPVEIKSVGIQTNPAIAAAPPLQGIAAPQPGSGVISGEPKKVHTIAIHPDQSGMAGNQPVAAAPPPTPAPVRQVPVRAASNPPPAANQPPPLPPRPAEARAVPPAQHTTAAVSRNAPLSLNPNAPPERAPMRTAAVAAPAAPAAAVAHSGGGYAVQVSSQRSEADAQAAFRSLQAKFPKQLGGRQAFIHKVDLGAKGTYYRAMVGPFANANEAGELCSGLKAAGGQCLIQRN